MEKDKIIETLKSAEDIEPSEKFREKLYLKIEKKNSKKTRFGSFNAGKDF